MCRSDRMWSLPISPAAAIIYESIHSGALNGSVDSDGDGAVPSAHLRYRRNTIYQYTDSPPAGMITKL